MWGAEKCCSPQKQGVVFYGDEPFACRGQDVFDKQHLPSPQRIQRRHLGSAHAINRFIDSTNLPAQLIAHPVKAIRIVARMPAVAHVRQPRRIATSAGIFSAEWT